MARRLNKEFRSFQNGAVPGITVNANENDLSHWTVKMSGPSGSPYEGGIITLKVTFPENYPHEKPKIWFEPYLYHPNVSQNDGIICIGLLQNYAPATSMIKIFEEITEVLINPNPGHFDEGEIAALYATNKDEYIKKAREWTAKNCK